MDQTWQLPVVRVLNTLSYLKAKAAHDKELIKQWRNQ